MRSLYDKKADLQKSGKESATKACTNDGKFSLQKAVVTDALGFIGFHLCRRLLDEGIEVAAIDDLGTEKRQKENRMDYFGRNALFTFIDGKIGEVSLKEAFEGTDVCFYLAGESFTAGRQRNLYKSISTLCRKVRALADAAGEQPPHVIYASSTDVYGRVSGKVDESAELSPTTPHGILSLTEEAILLDGGLPVTVLRLPEVYGPGQPSSGGFHQLLSGGSFGHEPVDVLYIDDAIEAFLLAAAQPVSGIFNVASGKPGEWHRGMEYILGEMGSDVRHDETWFSIEKAERTFGFTPKVAIKEGIDKQKKQMRNE